MANVSGISSIIANSGMGTRIPESMLGIPSRGERYYPTFSMDPIDPVARRQRQSAITEEEQAQVSGVNDLTLLGLLKDAEGITDNTSFQEVLSKAVEDYLESQKTRSITDFSDLSYYQSLMNASSNSAGLIADSLGTLGISGLSALGL
ncbi:MAG: hypothetical protein IJR00_04720 [Lachnospiraceae bacterium]|nr:hypothetical protein [Lachnospiraceae bacterium]